MLNCFNRYRQLKTDYGVLLQKYSALMIRASDVNDRNYSALEEARKEADYYKELYHKEKEMNFLLMKVTKCPEQNP